MNQDSVDVDLRKMVVFTLTADAIVQKVSEMNLTTDDILVLKLPSSTPYCDVDELASHVNTLARDRKYGILVDYLDTSYETMTTEELIESKRQIEMLLESRNA